MLSQPRSHSLVVHAALFLGLVVMLAGVGSPPAEAQQLTRIRINKLPIAPYVPMDVALDRGWFREEGLDVTIDAIAPGGIAMQALIGGKLDVIYGSLDAPLRAHPRGIDVMIFSNFNIAQTKVPDAAAILVRKDGPVKTLKDLQGKRMLVNSLQNINWAYSREAMRRAGADPNKVQYLELGFPQMVDALLGNQAEAASTTEPFTTIGQGTGKLVPLSYMFTELQPGLNVAGWWSTSKWVKENPRQVQAFRRVLQRAIDLLEKDSKERVLAIMKFTPLKPDLLSRMTLDKWTTKLDVADLQKQLEVYRNQGMIEKTYDVRTIIAP